MTQRLDRLSLALLYALRLDRLCGWLVRQLEPDDERPPHGP